MHLLVVVNSVWQGSDFLLCEQATNPFRKYIADLVTIFMLRSELL
jgi:hypothetical protein